MSTLIYYLYMCEVGILEDLSYTSTRMKMKELITAKERNLV